MLRNIALAAAVLGIQFLASAQEGSKRILVVTETNEYEHLVVTRIANQASLVERTLQNIGRQSGAFETVNFRDEKSVAPERLKEFDAVLFFTQGIPPGWTPELRHALVDFVKSGKGFIGVHCRSGYNFKGWSQNGKTYEDTFPELTELIGALVPGADLWGPSNVIVEDKTNPATKHLSDSFKIAEQHYSVQDPLSRQKVHVLLSLDPKNQKFEADRKVKEFAIAWTRELDKGRVFYTSLGHLPETWRDERFQKMLLGAVQYVCRTDNGALKAPVDEKLVEAEDDWKPEEGFTSVFNGKTFDGWYVTGAHSEKDLANPKSKELLDGKSEIQNGRIRIENGVIDGNCPIAPMSQNGDLYTQKKFARDFIYRVESRDESGGDSGVYVRVGYSGHDGQVDWSRPSAGHQNWNQLQVTVTGTYAEGLFNGKKEPTCFFQPVAEDGSVGVQVFMNTYEFRHLRIQEDNTAVAWALKRKYGMDSVNVADLEKAVDKPGPDLVPALLKALHDDDYFIRYESAKFLSAVYSENPAAAEAVNALLKSDRDCLIGITMLLRANPKQPDLVPAITAKLAGKDASTKKSVIPILKAAGKNAAVAVPTLVAALKSAPADLQFAISDALISINPASAEVQSAVRDCAAAMNDQISKKRLNNLLAAAQSKPQ
jgi:type 1 glutamine amidotransferase